MVAAISPHSLSIEVSITLLAPYDLKVCTTKVHKVRVRVRVRVRVWG